MSILGFLIGTSAGVSGATGLLPYSCILPALASYHMLSAAVNIIDCGRAMCTCAEQSARCATNSNALPGEMSELLRSVAKYELASAFGHFIYIAYGHLFVNINLWVMNYVAWIRDWIITYY
jgi:hypothetical protein